VNLLLLALGCANESEHAEHEHEHEEHDEVAPAGEGEIRIPSDLKRDLRITTAVAREGATDEAATVLGELQVDETRYAAVGTPVVARIRSVRRQPGDVVAAGEVLAELDSAELGRVRAEVVGARARSQATAATVERKTRLAAATVSEAELATARSDDAVAQAELAAAEAALAAFGAEPDGGAAWTLRAPVAGTVIERDARVGELADPGQTLFRVADLGTLWLLVHAFERDALRVVPGTDVEVTFAALPNRTFPARVEHVGLQVDPTSRTVPVRVVIDNRAGLLRPGMSATARLPLSATAGVVSVPARALQRLRDGWVVFVPRDADTFEVRGVGRGRDAGDDVEVLSGLVAGDTVVVDGAFLLKAEAEKRAGGGDAHGH
jgi:cobalt-zinc-cadmium efflux system membrane fusion protein